MRLKYVEIGDYKNLKDFKITFDSDCFIDVFVGKNGCGKSNLFEALIEIFRHILDDDYPIAFNYKIEYSYEEENIKIHHDSGVHSEKSYTMETSKGKKKISKYLPENILLYYSGHNDTIYKIVEQYKKQFKKNIREVVDFDKSRRFILLGLEYKEILLACLFLQKLDSSSRNYLYKSLGIVKKIDEIVITLKKPYFADNRLKQLGYEHIEIFDPRTHFWGADGITKIFLTRLMNTIKGDFSSTDIYDKETDSYRISIDRALFLKEFKTFSLYEIFCMFDNLFVLEMIGDITAEIELDNGAVKDLKNFSDGQYQAIYIFALSEIFKDKNCLTLLDEPDAFLHPEWQIDFLKQVIDIADSNNKNNILMNSHSAVTLISHPEKKIGLIKNLNKQIRCISVNKQYAINQLSADLLCFSEHEQIISILNTITNSDKPVLFTEGSTDPIILNNAWNKLYEDEIPINIIYAFNCEYLRRVLQDDRVINELNGKAIFGLFDFDEAYNEWNSIKEDNICESDPYLGKIKKVLDKNSYAILLPIPCNDDIEPQVIKNKETKETYCHESELEIEHLFYSEVKTHEYFSKKTIQGGGSIISFCDSRKTEFAQNVVPKIDKKYFEVFRPMFDFIKSKC